MSDFITIKSGDTVCRIAPYGATLVSFEVGGFDCVLGYDTLDGYEQNDCYFGATIGRTCNRTPGGKINVLGRVYDVTVNSDTNNLHGGKRGFDKQVWDIVGQTASSVKLRYLSKDGEEGYPANLTATAEYILQSNTLTIRLHGESDAPTACCLTNHSYFNLGGETVLNHTLQINADEYGLLDAHNVPYATAPVKGTPFDFTAPHEIGERINDGDPQLLQGKGYDHHFALNGASPAAVLCGSKAKLTLETSMEGLQFYSGNFIKDGTKMKCGVPTRHRCGLALEPQHIPGFAAKGDYLVTPQSPFDAVIKYTVETF